MILEAIVTTRNADGTVNVAPMGPKVDASGSLAQFVLRPFRTSRTYTNLKRHPEGVLHVTDDALMIARAAIGEDPRAEFREATNVRGCVIASACRYSEFCATEIDDREERTVIRCAAVASVSLRDFFGFNRAKAAVIEAAVLATRVGIVPFETIAEEFRRLVPAVEKTGGPDEFEGFRLLVEHVRRASGDADLDLPRPNF